ncbi:MAG: hypothetical protein DLM52_10970 [Chthoniobacterales bacterium]|nr:MAG: hypothetical protein DLM52_10970 [Chthoniobacterales bacterium]
MKAIFRYGARWILFGALVFAPWAYGATEAWAINALNYLLLAMVGCWGIELLVDRRRPRLSPYAAVVVTLILCLGWWMVINANATHDYEYDLFVPIQPLFPNAAGSVDHLLSAAMMVRITLLLATISFVADSMREPEFVIQLWWMVALAGTSIAVLGLLQKATGAEVIFWKKHLGPEPPSLTFFATYVYHANAGAFQNLTWPFAAGLALRGMERNDHPLRRALLISFAVIDLVAIMANTSRAAQLIGGLLLFLLLMFFLPSFRRRAAQRSWKVTAAFVFLLVLAILAIAYSSQWTRALARWQIESGPDPGGGRRDAARFGWQTAKEAGWFGFGPGPFRVVFPRYSIDLAGTWRFLHEDYLQTIIEWGWAGMVCWVALIVGATGAGARAIWRRSRQLLPRYRTITGIAVIALAGVLIHAVVDFPLQIASIQLYAAVCLGICERK